MKISEIAKIIVHCSDSDNKFHDDISVIDSWHKARGFAKVGYHFFIKSDGTIQKGRDLNEQGAHCKGQNSDSIGVCLHGIDKFSLSQFRALIDLCNSLDMILCKRLDVFPHNKFSDKTCPNFDVYNLFKIE